MTFVLTGASGRVYKFAVVRTLEVPGIGCVYAYFKLGTGDVVFIGETTNLRAQDELFMRGTDVRSRCVRDADAALAYIAEGDRTARILLEVDLRDAYSEHCR